MRCGRSRDLLPRSAPKGPKREKRKFLMAINPEDLLGFELLDEPEDPLPPLRLCWFSQIEKWKTSTTRPGGKRRSPSVQRPQNQHTHSSYLSPPEIDSGRMTTGMIFQAHADIIRFAEVAPQHQMPAYLFANGIEIGDHLSSLGRSTVVVPTIPRRGLVRQLSPGPLSKLNMSRRL